METASTEKTPRSFDKRKAVLATLVLFVSLGVLGWEILDYRRSQTYGDLPPIEWRKASVAESKAVVASIKAQLEAFKRDDYKAATKYQSAGLRRNFASLEQFRAMIQGTYPLFAHYKSAEFGPVQADEKGKLAMVNIKLTGSDGQQVFAGYQMVLEEGLWRVAGVSGGSSAPRRPKTKPSTTA